MRVALDEDKAQFLLSISLSPPPLQEDLQCDFDARVLSQLEAPQDQQAESHISDQEASINGRARINRGGRADQAGQGGDRSSRQNGGAGNLLSTFFLSLRPNFRCRLGTEKFPTRSHFVKHKTHTVLTAKRERERERENERERQTVGSAKGEGSEEHTDF